MTPKFVAYVRLRFLLLSLQNVFAFNLFLLKEICALLFGGVSLHTVLLANAEKEPRNQTE